LADYVLEVFKRDTRNPLVELKKRDMMGAQRGKIWSHVCQRIHTVEVTVVKCESRLFYPMCLLL